MNVKLVAIGVAAIMVVAAVASVAVINQKGDDKTDEALQFDGKWYASYYEFVELVDEDHKPFTDADKCPMTCGHLNTDKNPQILTLKKDTEHSLTGSFGTLKIAGTIVGNSLQAKEVIDSSNTHQYMFKGYLKDGYLSISFFQMDLVSSDQVCFAGYVLLIPENGKPVSHLSDRIDYRVINPERISVTEHQMSDFTDGDGTGSALPNANMKYVKSNTMISLFNLTGTGSNSGVQVVISNGATHTGIAVATVCGNMVYNDVNHAMFGEAYMTYGKWHICQTLHYTDPVEGKVPAIVKFEYNVEYYHGDKPTVRFLDDLYEGSVTIWENGKSTVHNVVRKDFKTMDYIVYGFEEYNGVKYQWFGTVFGGKIDFFVKSKDVTGIISGIIDDDGKLLLRGILTDMDGNKVVLQYDLKPVKK